MSRKYTIEEVRDSFTKRGCVLLTETYENNKQKLSYICQCGNKSEIRFDKFSRGGLCKRCGTEKVIEKQRYSLDFIKDYFAKCGCELVSDNYENNKTQLEYVCRCGNKHTSSFDTFKKSQRCRDCWKSSLKGKTNPNYNSTLTDEYREYKRISPEYVAWRKSVFERDSYICVRCESHGYLEAHHLNGFHWFEKGRYDVNNGVTLCSKCHDKFHAIYGRHNNTKAQYDEWISERSDEKSA